MGKLNIVINEEMKEKLRFVSAFENKSISSIVRDALVNYFEDYNLDINKIPADLMKNWLNTLPEEKLSKQEEKIIKETLKTEIIDDETARRILNED